MINVPASPKGAAQIDDSYVDAVTITPSDTTTAVQRLKGIRALHNAGAAAGTISIITEAAAVANEVNGTALPAAVLLNFGIGEVIQIQAAYVKATGTTATVVVGLIR